MKAIHQLVAGFNRGDAISNESVALRDIFRSWGFRSEIYSEEERIHPKFRHEVFDVGTYTPNTQPDDVVLNHLSIGSNLNDVFASLPARKAILYHNITPAEYYMPIRKQTARTLALGRNQAEQLRESAEVVMADSRFNAGELEAMGYRDVKVLPLVLNFDLLDLPPDQAMRDKLDDGRVNILFVGRCAPNKRVDDALRVFAEFQHHVEPRSRFIHAGSFTGVELYRDMLLMLAKELRLTDVVFTGAIAQAELNACYKAASVFLCMSDHEGFCIPLLESMHNHIPVLAYAAAAVPETMASAGVLAHEKDYRAIAEMMDRLAKDTPLRNAVLSKQQERLKAFKNRKPSEELKVLLAPLLS